jgi:hypothetical protein
MKKLILGSAAVVLLFTSAEAQMLVGAWNPVFQGVDFALGTNLPSGNMPNLHVVHALRLDLTDPDLQLFTDPPCTNCPATNMTRGNTTSGFLEANRLQGAVNYSFFLECCSGQPGDPMTPFGLLISQGQMVSPNWTPASVDPRNYQTYYAVLLFGTNKAATFIASNYPPTNLAGIYTAVAGNDPLLVNGVALNFDPNPQPRTALGLSRDGRYLYLVVVDGRQPSYSDGASYAETAAWFLAWGAWNAIDVDGGGSATMVLEDCPGKSLVINSPIQNGVPGTQRVVAGHLGFYAKPLSGFISDVQATPGGTSATLSWTTASPANTQVEYGLTPSYEHITALDTNLVTAHTVTLTDLSPTTNYFYRVVSRVGGTEYSYASCFSTTNLEGFIYGSFFDVTKSWKYMYGSLDGQAWPASGYADASWPAGPALLYVDSGSPGGAYVQPKGTSMPTDPNNAPYPYVTYYFRTHFSNTFSPAGMTLTFSNFLDDGAIFYLNGTEIFRAQMSPPPTVYTSAMTAAGYSCSNYPSGDVHRGNACTNCPTMVYLSGSILTNLVQGDNVLAAEVHNYSAGSPDITFGSALYYAIPAPTPPPPFISNVVVIPGETTATVSWTTLSNSTSQVQYGLTSALGSSSPSYPALITNHSVTLSNLLPLTPYYFLIVSTLGTNQYTYGDRFSTIPYFNIVVNLTNAWRYTTNNLDGVPWPRPTYNDSGWLGEGPALLAIEDNPDVQPKNTRLPGTSGALPPTYYFRTKFLFTNSTAGFSLLFSNYVDDGAVFYLNGTEIYRLRMAAGPFNYTSLTTGYPVTGDAVYPDLFRIYGDMMTNLVVGTNVLAAEVHQVSTGSSDITFGSAVILVRSLVTETKLRSTLSGRRVCISWDGLGFTLQQAHDVNNPAAWTDVPGPVTTSPYCVTNPPGVTFYRLRQ